MFHLVKCAILGLALQCASRSTAAAVPASSSPHVRLSAGTVKGSTCPNTGVKVFRGIPYAESTGGTNRFMPPKAFLGSLQSPDGGPFDATEIAAPCIQFSKDFSESSPKASENCLTVDVYMPGNAHKKNNWPVKVWAYGGSNEGGATSDKLYDACHLATDAVVVEFNYRLGPLGFLTLPSAGIHGNMAIRDSLAALKWVHHNIVSFGGDKSQVMLFGQSAGADDTFFISTLPQAPQLLKGVVTESGGGGFLTPMKQAQEIGQSFAAVLNCTEANHEKQLACLQSLSTKDLAKAYANVPAVVNSTAPGQLSSEFYGISVPGAPDIAAAVLDGHLFTDEPLRTGPKVPILAGAAQRDTTLFVIPALLDENKNFTSKDYDEYLQTWGKYAREIGKRYPLSEFNTTGSTNDAYYAGLSTITTLAGYICPSHYTMLSAEAAGTPSFSYRWNHTLTCPFSRPASINYAPFPTDEERPFFGPTHISDVPFAFGNLDLMPLGNGTCNATQAEHQLSKQIRASWTAMAVHGNPSAGKLQWPRFKSGSEKGVVFNDEAHVGAIDFAECRFWGRIWNELSGAELPFLD